MAEEIKNSGKTATKKTYSESELNAIVKQAVAEALKAQQAQTAPIIQVATDEYVTIMYIGQFATGCTVAMPEWGTINRSGGTLDIPKKEFIHGLGQMVNSELLKKRRVIVLTGLTSEERARYGVNYNTKDNLTQDAFLRLLDYPQAEIVSTFKQLCPEHKKVVAEIYMTAYFGENGTSVEPDKRLNIETVKKLQKVSKEVDKNGMFTPILEAYGRKFAE